MIRKQTFDLTSALQGSASSTQRIYKRHTRAFLEATGPCSNLDLAHIDTRLLRRVLTKANMQRWLVARQQRQPPLGQSALDLTRSALVFLARTAAEQGVITEEAYLSIRSVPPPSAESGQNPGTWLTPDDVVRFIQQLATPNLKRPMYQVRNQALILLMLYCGLRVGEAAAARWGDLLTQGRHRVLRIHGKGEKVGYVKLPSEILDVLDAWRVHHPDPSPSAFMFVNVHHHSRSQKPLTGSSIWREVQNVSRAAGLPALSPHDLRRTFARLSYEAGASHELIRQTLRHAHVTMTEHYVNAQLALEHTATDFLAAYLEV